MLSTLQTAKAPRRLLAPLMALAALALGASACQDALCLVHPDGDAFCEVEEGPTLPGAQLANPIAFSGGVAWRVQAADRVTLLHTDHGQATVEQIEVPRAPSRIVGRPTGDPALPPAELLVLSQEARTLTVLDTEGANTRQYNLGSPFTDLALSPDGRYAIAWFSPGAVSTSLVRNISELAIIDLDARAEENINPQVITLRTFSSRPLAIDFAPAFDVRGQTRRVALVISTNYVSLLELDNPNPDDPNVNERVVHFVRDASRTITPSRIVWTEDPSEDDDMFAFILASGSDDIISLNLIPGEELDAQQRPRLRPSLNQLSSGRAPVALATYDLNGQKKLISVNAVSRDFAIIDVATGDTALVPYEGTFTSALVFTAVDEDAAVEEPHAMLYSPDGSSRVVAFIDLASVETRGSRAITNRILPSPISRIDMTTEDGRPRAVILHPDRRSFSILDLERQAVASLEVSQPIADYTIARNVGAVIATYSDINTISMTDLRNAHSLTVDLDRTGGSVFYVPGTDSIVIDHGSPLGAVTVLPYSNPTRENATTFNGLATFDIFSVDP